jgi:MFS family permease
MELHHVLPQYNPAFLPFGACFGASLSGPLLQKTTRRNTLIITDLIGICGTLLQQVKDPGLFFFARFIMGIAVGLNSALVPPFEPIGLTLHQGTNSFHATGTSRIPQLVNHLPRCPSRLSSRTVLTSNNSRGYPPYQPDNDYWRIVFIIPILPATLRTALLLSVFRDDPPGYYVRIGDKKQVSP